LLAAANRLINLGSEICMRGIISGKNLTDRGVQIGHHPKIS
jgi:hypothetical protein